MTRVLNLYAGIGGNRAGWPADAEVTSVELDPDIVHAYNVLWPDDTVITGDAHAYLLEHFTDDWDLIWSSPPCPSHSKLNRFQFGKGKYRYPDLNVLYGEILLLKEAAPPQTAWVVENVIPYYPPLIPPTTMMDRHYLWSNRELPYIGLYFDGRSQIARNRISPKGSATMSRLKIAEAEDLENVYGIQLPDCTVGWDRYKRRQTMRNCTDPKIGTAVWKAIFHAGTSQQGTLLEYAS